jgi:hypothetical protein
LTFASALAGGCGKPAPRQLWPRVAAIAFLPAVLLGWTMEAIPVDSFSPGGWLHSLAFAAVAIAAPPACAAACAAGRTVPAFAALLNRSGEHRTALRWLVGVVFIALVLLSLQTTLGLVFDPRYRDIPFAPQCAALVPFLVLHVTTPRPAGTRAMAETLAAALLAAAACYIVCNEGFANWQAMCLCAGLFGLAVILARARIAPD